MRCFIQPYKQGSKGAKALAKALGGRVLRKEGSSYLHQQGDVIINWGDGECHLPNVLNKAEAIRRIANKRTAFALFKEAGVSIPAFAVSPDGVSWPGLTVVRHKLTGHSGEGIELVEDKANLPPAPLYVEYIKKEQEYRVHVGKSLDGDNSGTTIIAIQRKARDKSNPSPNWQVRNHANGFVFVRGGVNPPTCVLDEARRALVASGLDFGAVDVIYNDKSEKAYVLEINTAPGIEGTTISDYAAFFSTCG